jgi:hypothetical protein
MILLFASWEEGKKIYELLHLWRMRGSIFPTSTRSTRGERQTVARLFLTTSTVFYQVCRFVYSIGITVTLLNFIVTSGQSIFIRKYAVNVIFLLS